MSLTITYHGHSAFSLHDGERLVLIDPFISGNPVSTTDVEALDPTTILLTHAHNDHVGDTVALAKRSGATVIATFELANYIAAQGVKHVVGGNHGGTIAFDGGTTKFTPAWHTSTYEAPDGSVVAPGVPAGHVVRFGGKTIYHAGDTALFLDMQLIGEEELDVAILPIGDHFTMGPKDAARATTLLKAPMVIPCHYNTFPPIRQDPQAFKEDVEARSSTRVAVMSPGESMELDW